MSSAQHSKRQAWETISFVCWSIGNVEAGFRSRGLRNTACCLKGSRPSDPLTDIIFNLGMVFILSELDKCGEEAPSVQ